MSIISFGREDKTSLTKNFARYEFQCPCGCGQQSLDTELAEKLQIIRDKLGNAQQNPQRLPLSET